MNERYFQHIKKKYAPFLHFVHEHIPHDGKIVELGCGPGFITKALLNLEVPFSPICFDKDRDMQQLLHVNTGLSMLWVDVRDYIFNGMQIDVIHSHGLLEHLQDRDVRKIVRNCNAAKKPHMHFVPSHKYSKPSFGDERLMSPDQWQQICQPDQILEFNAGYDLILYWKGIKY